MHGFVLIGVVHGVCELIEFCFPDTEECGGLFIRLVMMVCGVLSHERLQQRESINIVSG